MLAKRWNGTYRYLTDVYITGHGTKQLVPTCQTRWLGRGARLANYKFGPDNDYITQMWQQHYAAIKNCNSVIDNVTKHQGRINNWERYVAEARGVRAYLYFDLVRWFGDVPLVLKETESLDDLKVPRTPQKQVFEQIIADFTYSMAHVAEKTIEAMVINTGVLPRMMLVAGSWLKYTCGSLQ